MARSDSTGQPLPTRQRQLARKLQDENNVATPEVQMHQRSSHLSTSSAIPSVAGGHTLSAAADTTSRLPEPVSPEIESEESSGITAPSMSDLLTYRIY